MEKELDRTSTEDPMDKEYRAKIRVNILPLGNTTIVEHFYEPLEASAVRKSIECIHPFSNNN